MGAVAVAVHRELLRAEHVLGERHLELVGGAAHPHGVVQAGECAKVGGGGGGGGLERACRGSRGGTGEGLEEVWKGPIGGLSGVWRGSGGGLERARRGSGGGTSEGLEGVWKGPIGGLDGVEGNINMGLVASGGGVGGGGRWAGCFRGRLAWGRYSNQFATHRGPVGLTTCKAS
eukprot:1175829-Prorocentrum_minimum.AAC.3